MLILKYVPAFKVKHNRLWLGSILCRTNGDRRFVDCPAA
jgi:hypothetical protein